MIRPVALFYPCELPPKLRQRVAPFGRYAWTVWTDAVRVARESGFDTPLDPFTPPGIVADWIRERDYDTTDARLLCRMLDAVQDAYDVGTRSKPYDGVQFSLEGPEDDSMVVLPATPGIIYDLSRFPWPVLTFPESGQ